MLILYLNIKKKKKEYIESIKKHIYAYRGKKPTFQHFGNIDQRSFYFRKRDIIDFTRPT